MLIIDGIIYSLQKHGGISVYFNEIISRLNLIDFQYEAIIYDESFSRCDKNNLNIEFRRSRLLERYRSCDVKNSAKVFHSSYYRVPSRVVPLVTTVHDFTYEMFFKGIPLIIHRRQKYDAIRRSQAIICVSENTKRDLLHYLPDINEKIVYVIPNGVGSAFYPIVPSYKTSNQGSYVLYVGARHSYKNFTILVDALSVMKDLSLVCVGGGLMTKIESSLISNALPNRFTHYPYVPDSELNKLYNDAFALVYPSSYEGFGIPPLEAMRAGCPVIALNCSSIPEVTGNAALLLGEASSGAIKTALNLLAESSQRSLFRERGFLQSAKFSWDKTFKSTLDIYRLFQ